MRAVVVALAIARLTTLVAQDEITRVPREAVDNWASGAPEGSLKYELNYLVGCTKCVSIWAAAGILVAERVRVLRPLVTVLAGSQTALAVATVIEKWERS